MERISMSASPPPNSVHPKTRAEWRHWLQDNHTRDDGVWLIRYKKSSGKSSLEPDAAIEEAICFGWIDSLPRKLDNERTMLYFAPRKAGSNWSALNRKRAEKMIVAGLMTPAGRAKIEVAKRDGSWTALDGVEELIIPSDLAEAFDRYPLSRENYEAFPRSVKRSILEWILNAKRSQTRAKRIEETARLAADNIRANQWRK
jgi:uncharacterized protein YdeI (YjbR/CyaY-like superfamily)